jgi:hypothetical protein
MNGIVVLHHFIYILISMAVTIWVGMTLSKNSRVFLLEAFGGNEAVADAVNRLLILGFYLINFGIVSLFLRYGDNPGNIVDFIELMSIKVGLILLLLGLMHFANMVLFKVFRRSAGPTRSSGAQESLKPSASETGSRFFGQTAKAA